MVVCQELFWWVRRPKISNGDAFEFTWDYRNRLTKIVLKNSGGTILKEERFTYDVNDLRIGFWVDADGAGSGAAVQKWIVYDGANPYAEFTSSTLDYRYISGEAIDELFARVGSSNTDWYLGDLLGSVRQIARSDTGTVLDALTYDSYGNLLSETSPSNGDRFGFAGMEDSSIGGPSHQGDREYLAYPGRWTREDPVGFDAGDTNLYRYVGNTVTSFTDPTGRKDVDVVDKDDPTKVYYKFYFKDLTHTQEKKIIELIAKLQEAALQAYMDAIGAYVYLFLGTGTFGPFGPDPRQQDYYKEKYERLSTWFNKGRPLSAEELLEIMDTMKKAYLGFYGRIPFVAGGGEDIAEVPRWPWSSIHLNPSFWVGYDPSTRQYRLKTDKEMMEVLYHEMMHKYAGAHDKGGYVDRSRPIMPYPSYEKPDKQGNWAPVYPNPSVLRRNADTYSGHLYEYYIK